MCQANLNPIFLYGCQKTEILWWQLAQPPVEGGEESLGFLRWQWNDLVDGNWGERPYVLMGRRNQWKLWRQVQKLWGLRENGLENCSSWLLRQTVLRAVLVGSLLYACWTEKRVEEIVAMLQLQSFWGSFPLVSPFSNNFLQIEPKDRYSNEL